MKRSKAAKLRRRMEKRKEALREANKKLLQEEIAFREGLELSRLSRLNLLIQQGASLRRLYIICTYSLDPHNHRGCTPAFCDCSDVVAYHIFEDWKGQILQAFGNMRCRNLFAIDTGDSRLDWYFAILPEDEAFFSSYPAKTWVEHEIQKAEREESDEVVERLSLACSWGFTE